MFVFGLMKSLPFTCKKEKIKNKKIDRNFLYCCPEIPIPDSDTSHSPRKQVENNLPTMQAEGVITTRRQLDKLLKNINEKY